MEQPSGEATLLLQAVADGKKEAAEELLPLVYGQLRALAGALFRRERRDHTLQPTAIVHEAWIKLIGSGQSHYANRAHFLAIAAQAMRRLLLDHAEARAAFKRGGDRTRVTLSGTSAQSASGLDVDALALHEALEQLAAIDARQARLVELRWFGGLTIPEVAELEGLAERTVRKDWTVAKAWLKVRLSEPGSSEPSP